MRLLNGPSLSEQRHRSSLTRSTEQQCISQGRAFNKYPLAGRRLPATSPKCGLSPRSINSCVTGRPSSVICVTAWKIAVCPPTPASWTVARALTSCATVKKQRGRRGVAVPRGHVQERCALKQEAAPARLAAIELRETLAHERRVGINEFGQASRDGRGALPALLAGRYLFSPPASSRASMQMLNCSGERPYNAMT